MPTLPSNESAIARSAGNKVEGAVVSRGVAAGGFGRGAGINTGARLGGGFGAETQAAVKKIRASEGNGRWAIINQALEQARNDITPRATNDSETTMN